MIKCVFCKEKVTSGTVYGKKTFIILKTSLSWDFDLMEFERTGGIS